MGTGSSMSPREIMGLSCKVIPFTAILFQFGLSGKQIPRPNWTCRRFIGSMPVEDKKNRGGVGRKILYILNFK